MADPYDSVLEVKDWALDIDMAGAPVLTVTGQDGTTSRCRFAREDLPELAAGLLRLAEHLHRSPPCGVVKPD